MVVRYRIEFHGPDRTEILGTQIGQSPTDRDLDVYVSKLLALGLKGIVEAIEIETGALLARRRVQRKKTFTTGPGLN